MTLDTNQNLVTFIKFFRADLEGANLPLAKRPNRKGQEHDFHIHATFPADDIQLEDQDYINDNIQICSKLLVDLIKDEYTLKHPLVFLDLPSHVGLGINQFAYLDLVLFVRYQTWYDGPNQLTKFSFDFVLEKE